MHDLTNVATAMRAYLELLETQGALEPRQKYYLDRAKEQVDTLVTTVRDLRGRLPQG
ncbi:MAG TPA: histidine kinase dimerization/phospho-acceptor domain-containing protein [Candidatus Thermoplasmatota archaeon]